MSRSGINTDEHAIRDLMAAQDHRIAGPGWMRPPRTDEVVAAAAREVTDAPEDQRVVVRDDRGAIRAAALVGRWDLEEHDALRCVFGQRNGTARRVVLPPPDDPDAAPVTDALVAAVTGRWDADGADAGFVVWPEHDRPTLDHSLAQHGFLPDCVTALRSSAVDTSEPSPDGLVIRPAVPDDEEQIVLRHLEELRAHEPTDPFTREQPWSGDAFRHDLGALWAGTVEPGGFAYDRVLVAEAEGRVIAMSANGTSDVADDDTSLLLPGRYGFIGSFGVEPGLRRSGVGRALARAALADFSDRGIDRSLLYFAVANPMSSRFWPDRMEFAPALLRWQRRTGTAR